MKNETKLHKFFLSRFGALSFPSLPRPKNSSPPSRDWVNWAIRVYVFSLLSHTRELLRTYLLLIKENRIHGAVIIARSLFEIAAHSYYVEKHTKQYLEAGKVDDAWQFLYEVGVGSRHMREFGLKDIGLQHEVEEYPENPHISKAIAAFDEYGGLKASREQYSFLSEFAHPSIGALKSYRKIDWKADRYVFPIPPPQLNPTSAHGTVTIAVMTAAQHSNKLLMLSGERGIAGELKKLLTDFVVRAKAKRV